MKLEALLHYFHVTCEPAVAGLEKHARALLLSNVDCVAAEAFITCKNFQVDLTNNLIAATRKFYEQIREHMKNVDSDDDEDPAPPMSGTSWLSFDPAAVAAKARTPQKPTRTTQVEEPRVIPQVIEFDHKTGAPKNVQDCRAAAGQQQSAAEWV